MTKTFKQANKEFNEAKKMLAAANKELNAARNNRDYDTAKDSRMEAMMKMRNQLEQMLSCINTTIDLETKLFYGVE